MPKQIDQGSHASGKRSLAKGVTDGTEKNRDHTMEKNDRKRRGRKTMQPTGRNHDCFFSL
jgi:hypothetical protein